MKRKRLLTAIATISVLALTAWTAFPAVARKVVQDKAAERGWQLDYRSAEWSWSEVKLQGVRASNAWLSADLDEVILEVDGTKLLGVRASGGSVIADMAKRPKGEAKSSIRTSAESLDVEVRGLCGSGAAKARGVGKSAGGKVWADKASGTCGGWTAEAELLYREGTSVTAGLMVVRKVGDETARASGGAVDGGREGVPTKMRVADLKVEADGRYVHALEVAVAVQPDGVTAEADSVAAEVVPEIGPVTATQVKLGFERQTRKFTLGAATMNAAMDAVSKERLEALTIMVKGRVERKDDVTAVDDLSVSMGKFWLGGRLQFADTKNFEASASFDKTPCQVIIDTAPKGFMDSMAGFQFSGTVASSLSVVGKGGKFDVKLSLDNRCKAEKAPPEMAVANFRKKFKRSVPGLKGDIEIESGPGSEGWTPLNRISPFMVKAVMTTEDTGFFQHRGLIAKSIENSLKENLEAGKFARGGSTVSMQLSKNLWLSRTKTISRKAQEFFLTTYLEQSLSKQEIIELYLNVVEFGPEVYGVRAAASHYFGKQPEELTVAECAFLASVLPSPKRDRFGKDGKLSGGWDDWVRRIVKTMRTRDFITDQEEADGLAQTVARVESVPVGTTTITVAPGGVDPRSWR
jgi:hypothetical protein